MLQSEKKERNLSIDPKEGGIEAFWKLLQFTRKAKTAIYIGQGCKPHKFFLEMLSIKLKQRAAEYHVRKTALMLVQNQTLKRKYDM